MSPPGPADGCRTCGHRIDAHDGWPSAPFCSKRVNRDALPSCSVCRAVVERIERIPTGAPGLVPLDHYGYCRDTACPGCLPTDLTLRAASLLALWAEMLNRAIPQTDATSTRTGALDVLVRNGPEYRAIVAKIREGVERA